MNTGPVYVCLLCVHQSWQIDKKVMPAWVLYVGKYVFEPSEWSVNRIQRVGHLHYRQKHHIDGTVACSHYTIFDSGVARNVNWGASLPCLLPLLPSPLPF